VLSARREGHLNELATTLRSSLPPSVPSPFVLPLDVLDLDAQKKALGAIISKFGRIDSLVLNAGRAQRSLASNTSLEVTQEIFQLNFFAAVNLATITLPQFSNQGSGQFVVISSVAGKFGVPISSSYAASKFALQGYFDSLRAEVSAQGIQVSSICPGLELTTKFVLSALNFALLM
jgi:short-subunit dehydrogenase